MASTAADVLIDTLRGLGRRGRLRPARRRHQRHHGGAAHAPGPDPLRPGPPRGVGRVHGLRLRQVHRQARRLPGHVRPRRHPPAQRPLRRQARRPAGAGDHRPDLPRPDRHPHAAGRRAGPRLRRRRRVQRAGHGADARRERRRPRLPHGAGLPRRAPTSPSRSTCRRCRPTGERSPRNVAGHTSDGPRAERPAAGRGRPAPRRRRAQRGPKVAILAGRGALGAGDELEQHGRHPGRADRQGAARQGGGARRQPLHHRARSACSARAPRRRRWRTATRC